MPEGMGVDVHTPTPFLHSLNDKMNKPLRRYLIIKLFFRLNY